MTKSVYKLLGFTFVLLALIGVLLPILPTTPFLLLAAGCFSRSSERWHQWLLSNKVFGPILQDWEENRCVSLRVKIVAISSMIIFGGYSVFGVLSNIYLQLLCGALMLVGMAVVGSIKLCDDCKIDQS